MEFIGGFIMSAFFIVIFFCIGLFLLNIITSIWAYKDALKKGSSKEYAVIVLMGTLFFPVVGLIIYLIIRNDK